jgi:hypothetical protein
MDWCFRSRRTVADGVIGSWGKMNNSVGEQGNGFSNAKDYARGEQ